MLSSPHDFKEGPETLSVEPNTLLVTCDLQVTSDNKAVI